MSENSVGKALTERQSCVIAYNGKSQAISYLPFKCIPDSFVGSDDVFSVIFAESILQGKGIEDSARFSMDVVKQLIKINRSCGD